MGKGQTPLNYFFKRKNYNPGGFQKYTKFTFALHCILYIFGTSLKYMVNLIPLIFVTMMSGSVSDFHNQLF